VTGAIFIPMPGHLKFLFSGKWMMWMWMWKWKWKWSPVEHQGTAVLAQKPEKQPENQTNKQRHTEK